MKHSEDVALSPDSFLKDRPIHPLLSGLMLGLAFLSQVQGAGVVINEIMHHPPGGDARAQWIELYNSANSPVDISGWQLTQGPSYTFPASSLLPAQGFLVVAADAAVFQQIHPGVTNFVAGWTGEIKQKVELSDKSGAPVNAVEFFNEGDWATLTLSQPHYNHRGWLWLAPHDGLGASLELINPALPNSYAHNWASNQEYRSTPGRANSVASTNTAPFVTAVTHSPVIPQPTDAITVTARLFDENPAGVTGTVFWRVDGQPDFTAAPMQDDGTHGDGLAGDRLYGAVLPPQKDHTIVEFYIEARDDAGNTRKYPDYLPPTNSVRTANLLYQVDADAYAGAQPIYRIIMTEIERAELYALGRGCPDSDSDAGMNATWITRDGVVTDGSTTQLRYNVGVRNRGHGSRQSNPNNYHIDIPADRRWKKTAGINLNSQYAFSQVLGSAVFRKAGISMPDSRPVQVRVNGTNLMMTVSGANSFGSYAANEQYNNDFITRTFVSDPNGNSYRCIRNSVSCDATFNATADLVWHGPDINTASYTNAYFKQNNLEANDWSDLISLIGVLDLENGTTAETYVADVRRILNVEEWMTYMAINTLLANDETALATGTGDDFALYRGVADPRFLVLPYDLDTLLGRGRTSASPRNGIFRMTALPVMNRFMKTPEFAPIYYRKLKQLAETVFSSREMDPLIDQTLGSFVPRETLDTMKAFNVSHSAYVLSQIPLTLAAQTSLPQTDGYPRTTTPAVSLTGTANAIETHAILVNGAAASYTAWQGTWSIANVALVPGINRIEVQATGVDGLEVGRTYLDVWYDNGTGTTTGGTLSGSNYWAAANGPYRVTSNLTVPTGGTLAIEPGTTLYLSSGTSLNVASGGRLLAEGTAIAPIRFTRAPGDASRWGGIVINGGAGSPETRIAFAQIEFNNSTAIHSSGGTVFLDHLTFGSTDKQYVSLDDSSFVVSNCSFPTGTATFELVHGTGGIKPGGHGIFSHNFFGVTTGYSDVVDFTGGNRPGEPIVHFINNVFIGSSDDILDLDGTDAWVEGNIFLHSHKNGSPDSSSAVSGGNDGGQTSEITIVGNIFYDCDQAITAKQGNFFTCLNNTIVHQTHQGGLDTDGGVVNLADDGTTEGLGAYLEGNIIYDAEKLLRNGAASKVTFTNNLLSLTWNGPGGGNITAAPGFRHLPELAETSFSTWGEAQIMRDWLALTPGSRAAGAAAFGNDLGGVIPPGIMIGGVPTIPTAQTSATFIVGPLYGSGVIPSAGWPDGAGYTHYRWRLDGGAWSAETPVATPIHVAGLANGTHYIELSGRRDTGLYQDDPLFGSDALTSHSRSWQVDTTLPAGFVRLNEFLARNATTSTNAGTTPDLIELHNPGTTTVDLSGMGLTDNQAVRKFIFAGGTSLAPGAFMTLYADNNSAAPGLHTGFNLSQTGGIILLFAANGTKIVDGVSYGPQLTDYSLGRLANGNWALCIPTFGAANISQTLGDPSRLRINEWLADSLFSAGSDFIELFNPDPLPVALGGLGLSDAAGSTSRFQILPSSYIAGGGYATFIADGNTSAGADHLNFKLSPEVGVISLINTDLTVIDAIPYGPQQTDISFGRSPSGSDVLASFRQPTPGAANPGAPSSGTITNITTEVFPLVAFTNTWRYNESGADLGTAWRDTGFDDSQWPSGPALFYHGNNPGRLPLAVGHTLSFTSPEQWTFYFRTHFTFTGSASNSTLNLTHIIDDGVVVYLNGVELHRQNMPAGAITSSTPASSTVSDASQEGPFNLPASALVQGENVLAVEVHQSNRSSSDIAMAVALERAVSQTNIVSNGSSTPVVVLNEVLAYNGSLTNASGQVVDWIEVYNPATNAASLAGLSLTDDLANARKWIFPADAIIAGAGYWVINCTAQQSAGTNNTGFNLERNGGTLYLFDAPGRGGALLDSVQYGLQVRNHAIGRFPNGTGTWGLSVPTPGGPNTAAALGAVTSLRVNEWLASNSAGSDEFELFNGGEAPVDLSGLSLTTDPADPGQSPISPLSFIGAGGDGYVKFFADGLPEQGSSHAGFKLSAKGEQIGLFTTSGVAIDLIRFGAQTTDVSEGRFPDGATNIIRFPATASLGGGNYLPLTNALINEVLARATAPLEQAVELYNPSTQPVDVSGWFLSSSEVNLKQFRLPAGTTIPAGQFAVLYQKDFTPAFSSGLSLGAITGGTLYLSSADAPGNLTGFRDHALYGPASDGVSSGRIQLGTTADFGALEQPTFGTDQPASLAEFRLGTGASNAAPAFGPIVINELMYHPGVVTVSVDPAGDEFIELYNPGSQPLPLNDPLRPGNTWRIRGGVDFDFAPGTIIPAQGYLVVVGFDPSEPIFLNAFRSEYNLPSTSLVVGPYSGKLNNSGEEVILLQPGAPESIPTPGYVPYFVADHVSYAPSSPWPNAADGQGSSLQRKPALLYGNSPQSWFAALPTAGRLNQTGSSGADTDGDGLPDEWEIANGFNPNNPADATQDADNDGLTNLQEFLAGTDPRNAGSGLRLSAGIDAQGQVNLSFQAVNGKTYSIQQKSSLNAGAWIRVKDVTAASTGPITVTEPATGNRFYRVVTPAQP